MARGVSIWLAVCILWTAVQVTPALAAKKDAEIIRREDAAHLFGKFLKETFPQNALEQKIRAEIEREKENIQQEIRDWKKSWEDSGRLTLAGDFTSVGGNTPLRQQMRFEYGWVWRPNEDRVVTFSLDTVDSGLGGGTARSIIPNLLRAEWTEKFYFQKQEWTLQANVGGDNLLQTATAAGYPEEQDRIWTRGYNQFAMATTLAGAPLHAGVANFGGTGSGMGNPSALEVRWGIVQGFFLGNGARVHLKIPTFSLGNVEWEGNVWGSSTSPDALAFQGAAQIGKRDESFWQFTMAQAGSQFRSQASEDTLWLSPTLFGSGIRNGSSMVGLAASWKGLTFIKLGWISEWIIRSTNQIQAHEGRVDIPLVERVFGYLRIHYFESSSGTSWRGTPIPVTRAWRVQTGVSLDIPSLHF